MKYKKALVTGGAGFIGSHLCERLLEMGMEVISVDDYSTGKHENIVHLSDYEKFQEVSCDITKKKKLACYFKGVDVVFHQAASKKTICLLNPNRDLEVNAGGTLNLLQLAVENGVKKFVHASTGSIYGEPKVFPQSESHPLNPVSYYGVSKLAGEKYVALFNYQHGLDTTILRYFHVYGNRQENSQYGGVVAIFIRNLMNGEPVTVFGSGDQERTPTYVEDVIEANIRAMDMPISKGKTYNCVSDNVLTVNEIHQGIARAMKVYAYPVEHRDPTVGDIMKFDVDNTRIKKDLWIGFRNDFEQTITEMLGA